MPALEEPTYRQRARRLRGDDHGGPERRCLRRRHGRSSSATCWGCRPGPTAPSASSTACARAGGPRTAPSPRSTSWASSSTAPACRSSAAASPPTLPSTPPGPGHPCRDRRGLRPALGPARQGGPAPPRPRHSGLSPGRQPARQALRRARQHGLGQVLRRHRHPALAAQLLPLCPRRPDRSARRVWCRVRRPGAAARRGLARAALLAAQPGGGRQHPDLGRHRPGLRRIGHPPRRHPARQVHLSGRRSRQPGRHRRRARALPPLRPRPLHRGGYGHPQQA